MKKWLTGGTLQGVMDKLWDAVLLTLWLVYLFINLHNALG
jgi:hypothetical protein